VFDWVLGGPTSGMTVSPTSTSVTTGTPVTFTATFSGLAAKTRYLGAVDYDDGSAIIGRTFVAVRTP
jgi:hypothetical protein